MKDFTEADMYGPVKGFFLSLGYEVRGEVKGCDLAAVKDDVLILVELKKNMNLTLIFQAMERQKLTSQVFVAVPRMKNTRSKQYKNALALVKKLELGLIFVAMDSPHKTVEFVSFPPVSNLKPKNKRGRELVLRELDGRTLDLNIGGSTKTKLLTAYRERMIHLACALEREGTASPKLLVSRYGLAKSAGTDLHMNNYGWFERVKKGVYSLSNEGYKALDSDMFKEIIEHYRADILTKYGEAED